MDKQSPEESPHAAAEEAYEAFQKDEALAHAAAAEALEQAPKAAQRRSAQACAEYGKAYLSED